MDPIEFFRLFVASLPSLLLLCAIGLLPFILLLFFAQMRRKNRIAFLVPLLQKAGFKPTPFLTAVFKSVLYQTPGGRFAVSVHYESFGQFGQNIGLVNFYIHLPHPSKFLICSPSFKRYVNSILFELHWDETRLDTLTPLGLQVVCDRSNADRIDQRLVQPEVQQLFLLLIQNQEEFYILSEGQGYFIIAFDMRLPSVQRGVHWLRFVKQFSDAYCYRFEF